MIYSTEELREEIEETPDSIASLDDFLEWYDYEICNKLYSFDGEKAYADYSVDDALSFALNRVLTGVTKYNWTHSANCDARCIVHNGKALTCPLVCGENNHTVFLGAVGANSACDERVLHCFNAGVLRVFCIDAHNQTVHYYDSTGVSEIVDIITIPEFGYVIASHLLFADLGDTSNCVRFLESCMPAGATLLHENDVKWFTTIVAEAATGNSSIVKSKLLLEKYSSLVNTLRSECSDINALADSVHLMADFIKDYKHASSMISFREYAGLSPLLVAILEAVPFDMHIYVALKIIHDLIYNTREPYKGVYSLGCDWEMCAGRTPFSEIVGGDYYEECDEEHRYWDKLYTMLPAGGSKYDTLLSEYCRRLTSLPLE